MSTSNRTYTDLVFDTSEVVNELVAFILDIEAEIPNQILKSKENWFDNSTDVSKDILDDMMTSLVRLNRSRKETICIRADIQQKNSAQKTNRNPNGIPCEVYDRNGNARPLSAVTTDVEVIPLVEFTELHISTSSVNVVLNLNECMILSSDENNTKRAIVLAGEDTASSDISPLGAMVPTANEDNSEQMSEVDNSDETEHVQDTINETVGTSSVYTDDVVKEGVKSDESEVQIEDTTTNDKYTEDLEEVEISIEEPVCSPADGVHDEGINEGNEFDGLTEVNDFGELSDGVEMKLRKPNEVYREMYKTAIAKAKRLRQVALEAYLDAKKIKARFMLDELGDSDDSASEYEEEEVGMSRGN
jgi:hypothetical protein